MLKSIFIICVLGAWTSCNMAPKRLPLLGEPVVSGNVTSYPTIANFSLTNQDNNVVTNQTFDNKIYVADFIFLSCPTICPKMTTAMHEAYLQFATNDKVAFVSHTIDPERDSISKLKAYANNLGVRSDKWYFLTGDQNSIFHLAEHSYFSAAGIDSTAAGGFSHSGGLLLIDKDRHIRGVYNATKPGATKRLITDIETLLKEEF